MHAFLPAEGCTEFLTDELRRAQVHPLPSSEAFVLTETLPEPPILAFARQTLPDAQPIQQASINGWADQLIEQMLTSLPEDQPWHLHLWPAYGEGRAGWHRCELIQTALAERLKKRRRRLFRAWQQDLTVSAENAAPHALVQAALTAPDAGFISATPADRLQTWRALVSLFPAGEIPHAEDKAAPSRAFAKVLESEQRLGQRIERGQTCVDLGASPGSWTYVALQRGASVTAIDRSPLRDDLMRNPRLTFLQADAFKYKPPTPVDWLICDIIAAPQRSIDLLLEWLRERRMRRFIVTLKFKGTDEYHLMDQLKREAPSLCADFRLTRLCANKNEVCAFGLSA
jgi:23S rRNA (cytidine2498-2'-O)-methyltransferase